KKLEPHRASNDPALRNSCRRISNEVVQAHNTMAAGLSKKAQDPPVSKKWSAFDQAAPAVAPAPTTKNQSPEWVNQVMASAEAAGKAPYPRAKASRVGVAIWTAAFVVGAVLLGYYLLRKPDKTQFELRHQDLASTQPTETPPPGDAPVKPVKKPEIKVYDFP